MAHSAAYEPDSGKQNTSDKVTRGDEKHNRQGLKAFHHSLKNKEGKNESPEVGWNSRLWNAKTFPYYQED